MIPPSAFLVEVVNEDEEDEGDEEEGTEEQSEDGDGELLVAFIRKAAERVNQLTPQQKENLHDLCKAVDEAAADIRKWPSQIEAWEGLQKQGKL